MNRAQAILTIIATLTVLCLLPIRSMAADAPIPSAAELISGAPQEVPFKGMVTMVDIGAHSCVPCKMMAPILKDVSQTYDGRAAIVFIDVWQHREEAAKYGIRAIPTQIFYDAHGKEQYRHTGYLGKDAIVAKLKELGVN